MVGLGVVAVVVCFCIGIAPFGVWILGYKKINRFGGWVSG